MGIWGVGGGEGGGWGMRGEVEGWGDEGREVGGGRMRGGRRG